MVVVYNCDERFTSVFAVSMLSLFDSNKDIDEITVYLIENGISDESRRRLQSIAEAYQRQLIILPMPDLERLIGGEVVVGGWSIATFGRLFVASLLPKDIDKVLYLDSDTLIVGSVRTLWDTDLSGCPVGMAQCPMVSANRELLGLPREGRYFNAGVMLIDLKAWREGGAEEAFLRYLEAQSGCVPYVDEGVLNAVFDGRVKRLPMRCDVCSGEFVFTYDQEFRIKGIKEYYTQEEFEAARKDPMVVHFTTTFSIRLRPWYEGCNHPYTETYLQYRERTPWGNEPLWKAESGGLKKKCYALFDRFSHVAPEWLYIWAAREFYCTLRPLAFRIKKQRIIKRNMKKSVVGGVILPRPCKLSRLTGFIAGRLSTPLFFMEEEAA